MEELDLPMSANCQEIEVKHFFLDLSCSFEDKTFIGNITYFGWFHQQRLQQKRPNKSLPKPSSSENERATITSEVSAKFKCSRCGSAEVNTIPSELKHFILDSYNLDVLSCSMYVLSNEDLTELNLLNNSQQPAEHTFHVPLGHMNKYKNLCRQFHKQDKWTPLQFSVSKHSVDVTLPQLMLTGCCEVAPFVIRIQYKTQARGPSLVWTNTQDLSPCVFTIGHLLNNRSLFPAQDVPQALSSWHCSIRLTDEGTTARDWSVLVAGDADPQGWADDDSTWYFSSDFPMPAATFALAIGRWDCTELTTQRLDSSSVASVPCRLFTPRCLTVRAKEKLEHYVPQSLKVVTSMLGEYPLRHLDILIVPACFDSLGMACPSLMLVSQSVLGGEDSSLLTRVSHELCHTWWGIASGPRDWTEEWLTEGVCCYLEDVVHASVMGWTEEEVRERLQLRSWIKLRLLRSEVNNSTEDLQTLRPNKGTEPVPGGGQAIKNGLNPEKTLLQVHYLKGYFLLQKLKQTAGKAEFLSALKTFMQHHIGTLYTSQDLLNWLFTHCSKLRSSELTVADLCDLWLDRPGLPEELSPANLSLQHCQSRLIQQALEEVSTLRKWTHRKRSRSKHDAITVAQDSALQFLPEQHLLVLELANEEELPLTSLQMNSLRNRYQIATCNAEVLHAWCELVIARRARQWYKDVESFLVNHQALGIYLYGELMISEDSKLQELARKCFATTSPEMPQSVRQAVTDMLFPS